METGPEKAELKSANSSSTLNKMSRLLARLSNTTDRIQLFNNTTRHRY